MIIKKLYFHFTLLIIQITPKNNYIFFIILHLNQLPNVHLDIPADFIQG